MKRGGFFGYDRRVSQQNRAIRRVHNLAANCWPPKNCWDKNAFEFLHPETKVAGNSAT